MKKYKFTKEYSFRASTKMIYPYISGVQGLSEWFVNRVWIDDNKVFHFEWQGEPLRAIMKTHKVNHFVHFEFFPKKDDHSVNDPNYVELKLTHDDLTGTNYLKITDYSEMTDELALNEMWDNFVNTLREKVGG